MARLVRGEAFEEGRTGRAGSARIDDEGRFVLTDLEPGTYALSTTISGPPFTAVVLAEVASGDEREVELVVRDDVPLHGRVITTTGVAVAGASVSMFDVSGVSVSTDVSNSDGTFELRGVQPGAYRLVVVGSAAWPPDDRRVTVGGTFDLVAGGDRELELVVGRTQSVKVLVLDALGRPVAGAIVRMRVDGEPSERSVAIDEDGVGRVSALRFGANARVSVYVRDAPTGTQARRGTSKLGPPLVTIDWTVGEKELVLRLPE
jgi:protocatechuate 3,4-dioxygenase beta subunit